MSKKTKVLFITIRSDMGGGPKHVYELCEGLTGIEVYIASPKDPPFYDKYVQISKAHKEIPHRKFSILKFFKLLQFCKEEGIDVIHSHGRGAGIYSRLLGLFGFRIIHTFHGVHHTSLVEQILRFLTHKFICVSEGERQNAIAFKLCDKDSSVVIPNGIDITKYANISSPNKNILGTISRLDPHKNNSELIEFMKFLPDYKLLIAGDGEEMEYLRSIAPSNVEFLGYVSDIPNFLQKIDIYVSASKGEGLPYSVLEAMAAGKKIVLSDVVGHKEIEGVNLYDIGAIDDYCEKIRVTSPTKLQEKYEIREMVREINLYLTHT